MRPDCSVRHGVSYGSVADAAFTNGAALAQQRFMQHAGVLKSSSSTQLGAGHGGAGQLTLDRADVGDIAALVDGDLGAGPVDVEVSLDNHVGGRGSEEALADGSLEAERVCGGAAEGREDGGRSRHGGARGGGGL